MVWHKISINVKGPKALNAKMCNQAPKTKHNIEFGNILSNHISHAVLIRRKFVRWQHSID